MPSLFGIKKIPTLREDQQKLVGRLRVQEANFNDELKDAVTDIAKETYRIMKVNAPEGYTRNLRKAIFYTKALKAQGVIFAHIGVNDGNLIAGPEGNRFNLAAKTVNRGVTKAPYAGAVEAGTGIFVGKGRIFPKRALSPENWVTSRAPRQAEKTKQFGNRPAMLIIRKRWKGARTRSKKFPLFLRSIKGQEGQHYVAKSFNDVKPFANARLKQLQITGT